MIINLETVSQLEIDQKVYINRLGLFTRSLIYLGVFALNQERLEHVFATSSTDEIITMPVKPQGQYMPFDKEIITTNPEDSALAQKLLLMKHIIHVNNMFLPEDLGVTLSVAEHATFMEYYGDDGYFMENANNPEGEE